MFKVNCGLNDTPIVITPMSLQMSKSSERDQPNINIDQRNSMDIEIDVPSFSANKDLNDNPRTSSTSKTKDVESQDKTTKPSKKKHRRLFLMLVIRMFNNFVNY